MATGAEPSHGPAGDVAQTPAEALRVTRLIWLALLMSQAVLAVVMAGVADPADRDLVLADGLLWAALALLVVAVPAGWLLRNQVYKKHWRADAVTPAGYVRGNLLFFALLELPGVLSAVSLLFGGSVLPHLVPLLTVLGVLATNYPHGRAMRPAGPRLGD